MKRALSLTAVLALSACAGGITVPDLRSGRPAPAPTPVVAPAPIQQPTIRTAKERLVGAIEANNCVLNKDNSGAIMTEATIGRSELELLIVELKSEGRVEISGDSAIRVLSDRCI